MAEILVGRPVRRRSTRTAVHSGTLLVWAAATLSIGVVVLVFAHLVVEPQLRITRVIVEADFEMERAALLEMAGLSGERSYFSVRAADVRDRLMAQPFVRSAEVTRVFPNTVRLVLSRRRPLAVALVPYRGTVSPAAFDEQGVVFARGESIETLDVPVVTGIRFEGEALGTRLPESLLPFLESLRALKFEAPDLYALVSEYRLDPRPHGGIDIVLYPKSFQVPVRISDRVEPQQLTYILLVLDVMRRQGIEGSVEELDFRAGEVVYRMKEDSLGRR